MKLRLQSDSIRFRLSEEEVQRLANHGSVVETVPVSPEHVLSYELKLAPLDRPSPMLDGCHLRIRIPEVAARAWAMSDEIEFQSPPGPETSARLVIERDLEPTRKRTGPLAAQA
jgi:hypothetical protein